MTLRGCERSSRLRGIITARNVDVGALISAGSSRGPARPSVQRHPTYPAAERYSGWQIAKLRILVSVRKCIAQYSGGPGGKVSVGTSNLSFPGKVTPHVSSLDAASDVVDRSAGRQSSGRSASGNVRPATVHRPAGRSALLVPGAALVRASGTMMAILTPLTGEDAALAQMGQDFGRTGRPESTFVAVKPGRDYGTVLEILEGCVAMRSGSGLATRQRRTLVQTRRRTPQNRPLTPSWE